MTLYRRQLWLGQWGPRVVMLLCAAILYPLLVAPLLGSRSLVLPIPTTMFGFRPFAELDEPVALGAIARPELADPLPVEIIPLEPIKAGPNPLASAAVSVRGAGSATSTNVKIAITFIDGYVIEPGAVFSFDDVARTWDYREDLRYVMGPATSARGPILMRGGGVCWLSTALWRAALTAGLVVDRRESHFLFVPALGAGLDATNTLVFRNDTDVPITVRVNLDGETVTAALIADGETDRVGTVRGPQRLSSGGYVTYQDVTWADGSTATRSFSSRYY